MLNLFQRARAEDVTLGDLRELCEQGAEEGHTLEIKERVPDNLDGSGNDRWAANRDVADRAKRAVLKSVIALANADGGWFVIGVREDTQGRAIEVKPIEDCIDLADRLGRVLASSIEPPLPVLGVRGVEIDENGDAGIVLVRVGASLLRPHRMRHGDHRHVYVRRGRESLEMSMWDIQSLTLETSRRAEALEVRLNDSLNRHWPMPRPKEPASQTLFGYTITASPFVLGPTVENVYLQEDLFAPKLKFSATVEGQSVDLRSAAHSEWGQVRPTLRGGERYFHPRNNTACVLSVGWDGHVNFTTRYGFSSMRLNAANILADIANVILIARDWSTAASALTDLVFRFDIRIGDFLPGEGPQLKLFRVGREYGSPYASPVELRSLRSPIYRVNPADPSSALGLALNDLYNAAGLPLATDFSIEFAIVQGQEV